MGNIEQRALIKPLALDNHLEQMDQIDSGLEEPFVGRDVNHPLDYPYRLIQHALRISDVVCYRERTPFKVSLKEQISFHMRIL